MRIWICLDGFTTYFTTHFTTNTTNTKQPHRIPTTTCAMFFFPCLFLHGFCSGLQHAERNRYSGLCWPRLFPKVGWYSKTCLNSLLNLVVESAVRMKIGCVRNRREMSWSRKVGIVQSQCFSRKITRLINRHFLICACLLLLQFSFSFSLSFSFYSLQLLFKLLSKSNRPFLFLFSKPPSLTLLDLSLLDLCSSVQSK